MTRQRGRNPADAVGLRGLLLRPAAVLVPAAALVFLTGAYFPGAPAPQPNLLVNPAMEIDQANEGASVALTSGTPAYIVDGWKAVFHSATAAVACQRAADAPAGFVDSLKCTVGSGAGVGAGDYLIVEQPIEASRLAGIALGSASAGPLCLSFEVKSSIAPYTMSAALTNFAGTRSYPASFSIAAVNTWTPQSLCFTGDAGGSWVTSGTAGGAYLVLAAAAGSSFQSVANAWDAGDFYGTAALTNSILATSGATIEVTAVKLENASAPTRFVPRAMSAELALDQRYYEKSYDLGTAVGALTAVGMDHLVVAAGGTSAAETVAFKTRKACDPTVTLYSPATGSSGKAIDYANSIDVAASLYPTSQQAFTWAATIGAGTKLDLAVQWTADCRL